MFFQAEGTFALPTPTTSIHYRPPYGLKYRFNIILLGMLGIIDKKKVKLFCGILFFFVEPGCFRQALEWCRLQAYFPLPEE